MKRFDSPLFLGASHIGQVFSIGWAKKFGKCSVYDFDQIKFSNFKNSKLTDEEPNLKKYYKKYKSNIQFIKESEIKKAFSDFEIEPNKPFYKEQQDKVSKNLDFETIFRETLLRKNTETGK